MTLSSLQADAWAAWNASYCEPVGDAYQTLGGALYRLDLQERITALFALSDEQNRRLDALLARGSISSREEVAYAMTS